ncbi:MAG TPA: 4Fe-4S binding protein, partial [Fimbriimonadaceae bacterium]|nr:4Fe-4S binding protein [Fimbriimonadaceae bacterium]
MALTPLPIVESKKPHSNRGKWRVLVLIGVHVLFAIHLAHWKMTGKTLSPVEPSEAMQTLELGLVNAGFILFLLLILSTLIFGRFFCGWGCHVVALQDLCSAMLGRLGIRPKPFRSRFLVFVPVFAALYMFVWPQVLRIVDGRKFPQLQSHLMTEDFWVTFPGPGIAVFTFLVCGFLAVMVLGNKGFCTYGCPYGAFFYNADRFALGKIRVTDACSGCGHCTAVCTSNVRVHEEVATHKMVVDPGCMKCMDCVDACPQNALFFGLGRPVAPPKRQKPHYDWSLAEDGLGVAFFLVSLYAFRGLYDSIPFLLALGLSSLSAFFLVTAYRTFTQKNFRLQRVQLKMKGRFKAGGLLYLGFALALTALIVHSTIWQVNVRDGIATMSTITAKLDPEVAANRVREARGKFETAERFGLFESAELHYRIGRASAYIGEYNSAVTR